MKIQERFLRSSLHALWPLWIIALGVYCHHAWVKGFFHDGYFYAALAKNAATMGHWLVPHLSNEVYNTMFQHPPLSFILHGLFFKIFGVSWTTARLFTSLMAVSSIILITRYIYKRGYHDWAWLTAILLIWTPQFIKRSRFPNIDYTLTFFIICALIAYYKAFLAYKENKQDNISWPLCGLFFGLALLTKGPPAIVICAAIGFHILLTNEWKILKQWIIYPSLLLGFFVFSLWPLAVSRQYPNFLREYFIDQLFGTIVKGRGRPGFDFYVYPHYLLTRAGPWFILSLIGMWQIFKDRKKETLGVLFMAFFFAVLIPFSFVKWKYSHYIIPIYPAMAALAAWPLLKFSATVKSRIFRGHRYAATAFLLIMLIFPVGTHSRRDQEMIRVAEYAEHLPQKIEKWYIVDDAYPFFNLTNFLAFQYHQSATPISFDQFQKIISSNDCGLSTSLFFVKKDELKEKTQNMFPVIFDFPNTNLQVLKGFYPNETVQHCSHTDQRKREAQTRTDSQNK